MMLPLDLASALTRAWTAAYTSGLPADLREQRRAEIDCDLWEHQWLASRRGDPATGTAIEILARMLAGMLSDITWRAQASRPARGNRSTEMKGSWFLPAFAVAGVGVVPLLILGGLAGWYWALVLTAPIAIGLFVVAAIRARRPAVAKRTALDGTGKRSRTKLLLLIIGASIATVVAAWCYAVTLDEWGQQVTLMFWLIVMPAFGAALIAFTLLVTDLLGGVRPRAGS
jgi:hypothetical protein